MSCGQGVVSFWAFSEATAPDERAFRTRSIRSTTSKPLVRCWRPPILDPLKFRGSARPPSLWRQRPEFGPRNEQSTAVDPAAWRTAGFGASFPLRHRPLNRALRALRSTPRTRRLRPERALTHWKASPSHGARQQRPFTDRASDAFKLTPSGYLRWSHRVETPTK